MDNSKQVETVKQVLDLEVYVSNTSQRLSALKSEQFGLAPKAPVKTTIKRSYPKIESQRKVNWAIAIILSLFFVPLGFIYYFSVKKAKERDVERIRNSAEYKARCAKLNAEYDRQQAAADRKYQAEKAAYDSRLLPEYKAALNAWNVAQKQKISQTERDLANAQNRLNEIYRATKVVPVQYRNINALKYIYSMISTSDYNVKQAIDLYDRHKQRKLDEARLQEQRRANRIADEQSALLDEQNALLDQQNAIANRARQEARQAATIAMLQRHKTNKLLKERNDRRR